MSDTIPIMFDLIGDIHGHADRLKKLLNALGYSVKQGSYCHSERKIIFIGDYIDRGPQIRETLEIVKSMTESNNAIALMGNHEYNALCFHMHQTEGGHVRKHEIKNIIQHYETLKQFQNRQEEYNQYIEWFKTLPLYYEHEKFRAVHACWDVHNIALLQNTLVNNCLNDALIPTSVVLNTAFNDAIDQTLKGKELNIPDGSYFIDKDGTKRKAIRTKWWENPAQHTYKSISVEPIENLPEVPVQVVRSNGFDFYQEDQKPVFFGHYWLKGNPSVFKKNICCLDYSVAKNGVLAAYRFHGENILDNKNYLFV